MHLPVEVTDVLDVSVQITDDCQGRGIMSSLNCMVFAIPRRNCIPVGDYSSLRT